MVRAEEKIPQDGTAVTHHHVLVQQGRLDDGVDQDLGRTQDEENMSVRQRPTSQHPTTLFKLYNTARGLVASSTKPNTRGPRLALQDLILTEMSLHLEDHMWAFKYFRLREHNTAEEVRYRATNSGTQQHNPSD